MDLTKFTKTNKTRREEAKEDVILDNKEIKATKQGDTIEITLNDKNAISKYQDFLFFGMTTTIETDNNEIAQQFFEKSINTGTEGVMVKNIYSTYKPGLRSGAMAKLKETKEDIDVVILAAEHGMGKRAGFYSSFYIAIKNNNYIDDNDKFLEVGKVSSGIKEIGEEGHTMDNLTRLLKPLKIKEENNIIYFEPKIIIQVRYQEIQESTQYRSGYALRFPRIISLREDKDLEEINSIDDLKRFK